MDNVQNLDSFNTLSSCTLYRSFEVSQVSELCHALCVRGLCYSIVAWSFYKMEVHHLPKIEFPSTVCETKILIQNKQWKFRGEEWRMGCEFRLFVEWNWCARGLRWKIFLDGWEIWHVNYAYNILGCRETLYSINGSQCKKCLLKTFLRKWTFRLSPSVNFFVNQFPSSVSSRIDYRIYYTLITLNYYSLCRCRQFTLCSSIQYALSLLGLPFLHRYSGVSF
jgi:hypothetical protein